jgi:N-acyl-D-aspartate/D-glutamate deacylase
MAYDLLLRNGRIVDGSGMPAFSGDIGVTNGKIVEIGKLGATAQRTVDVQGQAIAPGFIDNHCHFDGQVLWDPLCTFSCYHGSTTVINGNCSLGLAPARPNERYELMSMLSMVEAIPLESLQAGVEWTWETVPEYIAALNKRLGVNVGALMGFSAVRRHVMGEAAYKDQATPEQIEEMKAIVRDGMAAGALGLSFEREPRHTDIEGRVLPANVASNDEVVAVAQALAEVGAGTIQFGDAIRVEMKQGLLTRLTQTTGRPVTCPLANMTDERLAGGGIYPMVGPFVDNPARWTLLTAGTFDALPSWAPVLASPPEERARALRDPALRERLRADALRPDSRRPEEGIASVRFDLIGVAHAALERNQHLEGKTVNEIAREQGKDPLDAFLDLVLDEDLATVFYPGTDVTVEAKAAILTNPYIMPGSSDSGAHVTRRNQSHYPTYMLSYWVRKQHAMTIEEAVRRLTFMPASVFGLNDRGLIRPGMAADIVVFDPDTVEPGEMDEVADFPGGAKRMRRLSQGVEYTIVNGSVLIEEGEHTGAYPGRVVAGSR